MLRTALVTLFWSLLVLTNLAVASDAKELPNLQVILDKSIHAFKNLNYHVTLVRHHNGNRLQTMELLHGKKNDNEYEQLKTLSGVPEIVFRSNDLVVSQMGEEAPFLASRGPKRAYSSNPILDKIKRINPKDPYKFHGTERIAGRLANVLEVRTRESRFGYLLWVDQASALVSKLTVISPRKKLVEQYLMTGIIIKDALMESEFDQSMFKLALNSDGMIPKAKTKVASVEEDHNDVKQAWRVSWLPNGYKLRNRRFRAINDQEELHLVFSDGIAAISVVIAKSSADVLAARKKRPHLTLQEGTMTIFDWVQKNYQITVIGEIPKETAEKIARSVAYR